MSTPKRLDFTSTGDADLDDNSPPCSFSFSPRRSHRKRPAEETDTETKRVKKKNTKIWIEEDELAVLKGLAEYRAKTGFEQKVDWDAFFGFIGGSIVAKVSKEQLFSKLRKLKRKFLADLERINSGKDPNFTKSTDSEAFGFAMMIWGKTDQTKEGEEVANAETDGKPQDGEDKIAEIVTNGEDNTNANELLVADDETLKENEAAETVSFGKPHVEEDVVVDKIPEIVTNGEDELLVADDAETLKENVAAETVSFGKPHVVVDRVQENVIGENEGRGADIAVGEELCLVRDAFETMLSQGLSEYQKKLQLEKVMSLGDAKRQELSTEWKGLCVEAAKLNIKKLQFAAKLAEAATD